MLKLMALVGLLLFAPFAALAQDEERYTVHGATASPSGGFEGIDYSHCGSNEAHPGIANVEIHICKLQVERDFAMKEQQWEEIERIERGIRSQQDALDELRLKDAECSKRSPSVKVFNRGRGLAYSCGDCRPLVDEREQFQRCAAAPPTRVGHFRSGVIALKARTWSCPDGYREVAVGRPEARARNEPMDLGAAPVTRCVPEE
jgi:hypothetical protein